MVGYEISIFGIISQQLYEVFLENFENILKLFFVSKQLSNFQQATPHRSSEPPPTSNPTGPRPHIPP